ncbi:MAG: ribonuclease III [Ruminococcaceae bacterium]|nr:ribonuclease III [Oscillospiraceae bacterium]
MKQLGYTFRRPELLREALTHSSYCNEHHKGAVCNERLEFVGDAVLGLVAGQYLYETYSNQAEGKLSKLRAAVVCEKTLAKLAREIGLGEQLLLGHGEDKTGGRNRDSVLSDAFEAVIAAIYLDSDLETVREWILSRLVPEIRLAVSQPARDYKTTLQEVLQKKSHAPLEYRIVSVTGPDHKREYTVDLFWKNKLLARGAAGNKKQAEQRAAKLALEEKRFEAL